MPLRLRVAPITFELSDFSTGMDSPVSMDSFTEDCPSGTSPSVGTRSLGHALHVGRQAVTVVEDLVRQGRPIHSFTIASD